MPDWTAQSVNELTDTPRFEEAWRNMLLLYKYSMYRNDFRFIMSQYQDYIMTKLLSRLLDGRFSKINHSFNSQKWLHPSPSHPQMWAQAHLVSPETELRLFWLLRKDIRWALIGTLGDSQWTSSILMLFRNERKNAPQTRASSTLEHPTPAAEEALHAVSIVCSHIAARKHHLPGEWISVPPTTRFNATV